MIPRRVRMAVLIGFLFHGLFILTARYRVSYDAYTHMLFANHYAENWFSLWEARWYTGFTVVSYPPLTHQLIALFIPILGFDKAFALILWGVTSLYPVGIYAFARIFTGRTSASNAALASAVLLPIYVTAHVFSQLPFLTSTLTALFAAASLNRYLRDGGVHNFSLSVALITTSIAMHHATLMVHPFLVFAVFIYGLFRAQSKSILTFKLILFTIIAAISGFLVIFPFWQWGASQAMQVPIDHLSRHNFLNDRIALAIFFFPLYGPLLVIIPFLLRKWHPRFIGLLASFAILFILGLGGTTPLPRLLFGSAWEWLTYDRFAFWASLTLTPFFGILFTRLRKNIRFTPNPTSATSRRKFLSAVTFSFFTITSLGVWFTPILFPIQPKPVDMQPIVDFLDEADNSQWRYVTFGFGDQFAYLNLLSDATTIDGSYHTARTLPELRESGVGQIDTSYWASEWMQGIKPILKNSGHYGVRWGFVNLDTVREIKVRWGAVHRSPYVPILEELGWKRIKTLKNSVLVYENLNAQLPETVEHNTASPLTSFAWGVFPMLAFATALSLGSLRVFPARSTWVIQKIYSFVLGLLPIAFCFWLYRTIGEFPHSRVYFTYTSALFFLGDAFVILSIILWLSVKISQTSKIQITYYTIFILLLVILTSLSILWSRDWRISLYVSLHFWITLLFILSLREWSRPWKIAMFGFCAALSIQIIAGFAGFYLQSTAYLESLNMKWPGILEPSMRGASVVQLADGLRILRAYGTLPHPNILGGFVFILLLGPIALFLRREKPNYPALLLIATGISLLALTFSRSAWLALIAFAVILVLKSKYFVRKQLILLFFVGTLSVGFTLLPYRQLVQARTTSATSHSEQFSLIGRAWLSQEALHMILERPFTGVGIGSFIIALSQRVGEGYIIEPVHNILLLASSELGLPGLLIVIALGVSIALNIVKAKSPQAILAGATLAGLGVIGLFDHYLWTLAPGRIMVGLTLGLWAGQVAHDS